MAVLTLLGLIMLAIWAGSLYLWPFGPCLRCKGSGRRRRIGAKTIHRGTVSLADKARARRGAK